MQINEIERPHCDECKKYYGGSEIGVAYVFELITVRLCELCNEKFTEFFTRRASDRLQQLKVVKEAEKDGRGEERNKLGG